MIGSAYDLCEWWRLRIMGYLDEKSDVGIARSYSGVGVIPWDAACGQLTVSPEQVYRSAAFPAQFADVERCWQGDVAVTLLCTLVRCVPVLDERGRVPSEAAVSAANEGILRDASIIFQAVSSELPDPDWDRSLVQQDFVGADGGAVGIETRWTIGLDASSWCVV